MDIILLFFFFFFLPIFHCPAWYVRRSTKWIVGYGSWYMAESGRCTSLRKQTPQNPQKKEEPSLRLTPYLHRLDEYVEHIRTLAHHVRVILSESRIKFVGIVSWGVWASVMSMYLVPCT